MELSSALVKEFASVVNDTNEEVTSSGTAYGTIVSSNGVKYVLLDGASSMTAISEATDAWEGDRVIVTITNHVATVTSNLTSPASGRTATAVSDELTAYYDYINANYITADKIEANYASFNYLATNYLDATTIQSEYATIQYLDSTFATIQYLESEYITANEITAQLVEAEEGLFEYVNAQIIEAQEGYFEYLETYYLSAEYIKSNYIQWEEAYGAFASITDLEAAHAIIDNLDATMANIQALLAGQIGAEEGQFIHLTSSNVVIDDAVIVDAMIASVTADKIQSGTIYTSKVTIQTAEGDASLHIDNSTIQITDKNQVTRVQIGEDASQDYNLYLWDADANLLWNAKGLTEAGVEGNGGIIKDMAVADDANIQGYKLDIHSVASSLNSDGSIIVDASNVVINDTTLDVAYTEIYSYSNDALAAAVEAQNTANAAQSAADSAAAEAQAAQSTADQAQADAASAQSTADEAKANAESAQAAADQAQKDYDDLASRTDVTEEELAEAQKKLEQAQADADSAASAAQSAQSAADSAAAEAQAAQSTADQAKSAADSAAAEAQAAQSTADAAMAAVENAEGEISNIISQVTVLQTEFEVINGQITSKIWLSDITEAVNEVNEVITTLTDEWNTTITTVNGIETSVGQLQTTADSLSSQVTEITTTVDGIQGTIFNVQNDLSGVTSQITTIEASVDGISTTVSSVQTQVDKLECGVNLLPNSNVETTSTAYMLIEYITTEDIKPSTKYTIVVCAEFENTEDGAYIGVWMNQGSSKVLGTFDIQGKKTIFIGTFTSPTSINYNTVRLYNYPSSGRVSGTVYWCTMYEGEVTPPDYWTPSIADEVATTSSVSSSITQLANSISLTVSNGELGSTAGITISIGGSTASETLDLSDVRKAWAKDESEVEVKGGTITFNGGQVIFNSGTFVVNSTYFSVDSTGVIKATSGTIGPWNLTSSAISTGSYNTSGTMYFGTSGISLGNTFSVTSGGYLTATSGVVGGFSISSTKIYGHYSPNGEDPSSSNKTACAFQIPTSSNTWALAIGSSSHSSYSDAVFRVDKYGNVHAESLTVYDSLTMNSGSYTAKIAFKGSSSVLDVPCQIDCLSVYATDYLQTKNIDASGYLSVIGEAMFSGTVSISGATTHKRNVTIDNTASSGNAGFFITQEWSGKKVSLQVGSGGDNRGVYDDTFGEWIIYNQTNSDKEKVTMLPRAASDSTTGTANAWIGSSGRLRRLTGSSSIRYKDVIREMEYSEVNKYFSLPIHWFTYKPDYVKEGDERYMVQLPGFLAEEWNDMLPAAVDHDEDGQCEVWNPNIVTPVMFEMIKYNHTTIESVEDRVDGLELEIASLRAENDELKQQLAALQAA